MKYYLKIGKYQDRKSITAHEIFIFLIFNFQKFEFRIQCIHTIQILYNLKSKCT